jgi:hypothetical protein
VFSFRRYAVTLIRSVMAFLARKVTSSSRGDFTVSMLESGTTVSQGGHLLDAIERGVPVTVVDPKGAMDIRKAIVCATTRAVEQGKAVIVVDANNDHGMRKELARAARRAGRAFSEATPESPDAYKVPWDRLGEGAIVAMLLPDNSIGEPYYRRLSERHIVHVIRVLRAANIGLNLEELVRYLDPTKLGAVVDDLPASPCQQEAEAYLNSLGEREQKDIAGGLGRLSILAASDIAHWFGPQTPGTEQLDLLKAVGEQVVVYFNLGCHNCPRFSQILGAAIGLDLLSTAESLMGSATQSLVAITRFSEIPADQLQRLVRRGRAAGISMVLGTQGLGEALPVDS